LRVPEPGGSPELGDRFLHADHPGTVSILFSALTGERARADPLHLGTAVPVDVDFATAILESAPGNLDLADESSPMVDQRQRRATPFATTPHLGSAPAATRSLARRIVVAGSLWPSRPGSTCSRRREIR
jgi:hypothetical protein